MLADTGTSQFGMPDAIFPENVTFITQIFWSSIGYAVGGTLGACIAAKEQNHQGRVILIVGDGSLQMTVQEISSFIRFGLKPIIFVVNNAGYSIERAIHGPKQGYNDIGLNWDYQQLLPFFGARSDTGIKSQSVRCDTVEDLEGILNDEVFAGGQHIRVCELLISSISELFTNIAR